MKLEEIRDLNIIREVIENKFKEYGGEKSHGFAVGMGLEESKELLKRGNLKKPKDDSEISVENGRAGRCHEEAIEYWFKHHLEGVKIVDGYACSDGMWVKHGWCVDKTGKIHECTSEKRDLYYGYDLNEKEIGKFIEFWTPERRAEFLSTMKEIEDEER